MSGLDGRADRLYQGLSARERAVLALEAAKEDRDPDVMIRWTMPEDQVDEFNRVVRISQSSGQPLLGSVRLVATRCAASAARAPD